MAKGDSSILAPIVDRDPLSENVEDAVHSLISMGFPSDTVDQLRRQGKGMPQRDALRLIDRVMLGDAVSDDDGDGGGGGGGVAATPQSESASAQDWATEAATKLVLVVRMDLKMRPGKIASQCCHAALGATRRAQEEDPITLLQWQEVGEPVICVKCADAAAMAGIQRAAHAAGLATFVVADAGRTQVEAGSRTVLAVGPGASFKVDPVTRSLGLL